MLRSWVNTKRLNDFVLSSLEHRSGKQTTKAFIEHWVAKESVLKALGLGISEYLQAISILPDKGGAYEVTHEQSEWAGVRVWSITGSRGITSRRLRGKAGETEKRGGRRGHASPAHHKRWVFTSASPGKLESGKGRNSNEHNQLGFTLRYAYHGNKLTDSVSTFRKD